MKKKGISIRFGRLGAVVGFASLMLFGSGALGIVWFRMEISEVARDCGRMEDQRERVNRHLRDLRGQRSAAMRPTRLAQMVKGRLEMPPPTRQFYITLEDMRRRLEAEEQPLILPRGRRMFARNSGQ